MFDLMRRLALAVATLVIVSGQARADLLNQLTGGGTVTSGGLVFSDFTYTPGTGSPPSSTISVTPYVDAKGNSGIQIGGGFVQFIPGTTDAKLSYTVTDAPGSMISGLHMDGNPIVTPPNGNGSAIVTETATNINPTQTTQIASINPPGPTESLPLPGLYSSLNITDDILLTTSAGGVVASVSFIDQTFAVTAVPEPSTVVMIALSLPLGLAYWLRQRNSVSEAVPESPR